jgi:metal-responsive CopG/Arc/MetJ family transcriptional regulator
MSKQKVTKVTISLPQHLLEYADRLAKERATTRSGVVCQLLKKEETEEIHALMAEGYKEMAEENRRLAEEVFPLVSETMLQHTQWDEEANG